MSSGRQLWRRSVLIAAFGLVVPGVPAVALADHATSAPKPCEAVVFVGVRGSGETSKDYGGFGKTIDTVRGAFVSAAQGQVPSVAAVAINYPAIPFPASVTWSTATYPSRYGKSESAGVAALTKYLTAKVKQCGTSTNFVLSGYSQGAQVVGDTLERATPDVAARVVGLAMLGDPRFKGSDDSIDEGDYDNTENGIYASTVGSPRSGFGIDSGEVKSYCIGGDPICNFGLSNANGCRKFPSSCPHLHYLDWYDSSTHETYVQSAAEFLARQAGIYVSPQPIRTGSPSSVLIYGDDDGGGGAIANLAQVLTSAGDNVTAITGANTLPNYLSQAFGQIWFVGAYSGIPDADQTRLEGFVQAGGGLYLTGERPCCEGLNSSVTAIARTLTDQDDLQIGGVGEWDGDGLIAPGAPGGLATTPNTLTTWTPSATGEITNVADPNVFITASDGSAVIGAAWSGVGAGRLVVLMDINWLESNYADPVTMPAIAQNIATFLGGTSAPSPHVRRSATTLTPTPAHWHPATAR